MGSILVAGSAELPLGTASCLVLGAPAKHDAPVVQPSPDDISQAVVVWTGYRSETWPSRDDDRFASLIGADAAIELLPVIRRLESEFYESDAHSTVSGLDEMARAAAAEFRDRHPELSEEAVDALAWCYSWDWK